MRIMRIGKWVVRCMPTNLKNQIRSLPPVYRLRNAVLRWRYASAAHDDIYDKGYFARVENSIVKGAEVMASCILDRFSPTSAVDVGCGTGALLDALKQRGVATLGIDCSLHALKYCARRGVPNLRLDLANLPDDYPLPQKFDVAMSMEVAHQLPKSSARRFVRLLAESAPVVIFSAETPGTFDRLPLNEQPAEYWIDMFHGYGCEVDREITRSWRELWASRQLADFYCKNLLVFVATK